MAIKEISGHILEIGDRVKMNIPKIGEGDMDGVEFTLSGENYWRYMNTHPDEVYTVEGFDNSGAELSRSISFLVEWVATPGTATSCSCSRRLRTGLRSSKT